MAQYGSSDQTVQVTTGNVRTTMDKFDSTQLNNGAKNGLGTAYFDNASSLTNPNGVPTKYRYVRYNSANNAAVVAFPGVVFWADNTFTTVTSKLSEGVTGTINDVAGYLMPNSTDIASLTAAILNGNFVWMAVAGFVKGAASVASTAVGDALKGADVWLPGRTAANTAPTNKVLAWALTAIASSVSDVLVACESI